MYVHMLKNGRIDSRNPMNRRERDSRWRYDTRRIYISPSKNRSSIYRVLGSKNEPRYKSWKQPAVGQPITDSWEIDSRAVNRGRLNRYSLYIYIYRFIFEFIKNQSISRDIGRIGYQWEYRHSLINCNVKISTRCYYTFITMINQSFLNLTNITTALSFNEKSININTRLKKLHQVYVANQLLPSLFSSTNVSLSFFFPPLFFKPSTG